MVPVTATLPSNNEEWIECGTCDRSTCHRVLAQVEKSESDPCTDYWDGYQIIQCLGCRTLSFCHESRNSEDITVDPETGDERPVARRQLFPRRSAGRSMLEDREELPSEVRLVYEEAHNAFTNDLPIMTGFGIRAIIEAVCKAKGMQGNDLKVRIDALVQAGHVTKDGATILHSLRFMGNDAVHEMRAHKDGELSAAFQVAENLLQNVYIIPKLAENLPTRLETCKNQ